MTRYTVSWGGALGLKVRWIPLLKRLNDENRGVRRAILHHNLGGQCCFAKTTSGCLRASRIQVGFARLLSRSVEGMLQPQHQAESSAASGVCIAMCGLFQEWTLPRSGASTPAERVVSSRAWAEILQRPKRTQKRRYSLGADGKLLQRSLLHILMHPGTLAMQ